MFTYIFWTTSSVEEAKTVSKYLIEQKLVACVNIIPKVHSLYMWDGKLQEDDEVKVILKTKQENFEKIEQCILEKGSYDTPEISLVRVDQSHEPYRKWLDVQINSLI